MKQYIFIAGTDQFKSSNQEPCATCSQAENVENPARARHLTFRAFRPALRILPLWKIVWFSIKVL